MKKVLIFCSLIIASFVVIDLINFFDHLLAFLIIGQIPYTNSTLPALGMFFAWLSLPLIVFTLIAIFKGLFILSLITIEHIDRSLVAYRLSRIESPVESKSLAQIKSTLKSLVAKLPSVSNLSKRHLNRLPSDAS